jgi:hypothetical protein
MCRDAVVIDRRTARVGGLCSITVGILGIIVGATYFVVPPEQNPASRTYTSDFFTSILADFDGQEVLYWSLLFMGVFGVAVVTIVSDLVRAGNDAWVRWAGTLAIIGLGIQIAANALGRDYLIRVAPGYAALDASAQQSINLQGNLYNDWISFALVGFWLISVNVLAFRQQVFARSLAAIGIAAGVAYEIIALANVVENLRFVSVAVVIGIVAIPLWHFWVGIILLRQRADVA